jgi:urea carboxylase-associated protein 1
MSTQTISYDEVVVARAPWSHVVRQGQTLRIIDLGGNQAVDCLLYNADDVAERYCAATTIIAQRNIFLTTGSRLMSSEGNVMAVVSADTCGRHDTIAGACSQESNTLRYGHHTKHQHACVENFLTACAPLDMGVRDLVSNRRRTELAGALRRPARRDGRARGRLQLSADQQPLQRVRPDTGSHGHPR